MEHIQLMKRRYAQGASTENTIAYINEAKSQGVKLQANIYNTAISALLNKKELNKAVDTMKDMQNHGIQPTVVTFTMLIESFGKEGKLDKAEEMFRTMLEAGVHPDAWVYSVMINICANVSTNDIYIYIHTHTCVYQYNTELPALSEHRAKLGLQICVLPSSVLHIALYSLYPTSSELGNRIRAFTWMRPLFSPAEIAEIAFIVELLMCYIA